jgi:hypothetical protein
MLDAQKLGEQAHFRIDDIERSLTSVHAAIKPEVIAALVQGVVSTLEIKMQGETERLLKAVREDVTTDQEIIKELRELVAVLKAPITRTSTIELPTGPVSMTVTEHRGIA